MAMLSACAVGPDYHRPTTPAPDRFTESPLPGSAQAGDSDADQRFAAGADIPGDWWTLFRSPALTRLVVTAIRDNPSLAQAQATLHQAQETTLAQEGSWLPSLNGQFNRTRQELSGAESGVPGLSQTFTVYTAQLNVSYTFDVWGQNLRSVQADVGREAYQRFLLEGAVTSLAANTATAAINAAALSDEIVAERELLSEEQTLLERVRAQFVAGAVTGSDVAQQQAQVANTAALVSPLEVQLAQARDQLAAYTGRVPAAAALPALKLDAIALPAVVPVSVPARLIDQRPDIRASEGQVVTATANIGVAIANRLPQFTLTGSIGSAPARVEQLFTPGNGVFSIMTQVLAPIFQGGTLLHQQRAAVAAARAAVASYQNTVITAYQNVADALSALTRDGETLAAARAAEAASRRSLDLAQTQFRYGGATYLTVLTAETQVQNAIVARIRAQASRLTDTVALYTALGGGWWNRNDIEPKPEGFWRSFL